MIGYNNRVRPGAVIDCEDPLSMKAILFDKEMIASLKGETGFVDLLKYTHTFVNGQTRAYIRPRTPFSYASAPKRGWSTYEWVGFWNYALLITGTTLIMYLLYLAKGLF